MKWTSYLVFAFFFFVLASCKSQDEVNDLAKAQECLDKVNQTRPEEADSCLEYVEKYTSQQANILKCSIHMTSGGLVENKMVQAYKALEDDTITDKTMAFMTVLALDNPTTTAGYEKAVKAYEYCQLSGVPGLAYISSMILAGTQMGRALDTMGLWTGIDINDPATIESAVNQLVAACTDSTNINYGDCFPPDTDEATLGTAVIALSQAYCSDAPDDDEVCVQINSTVANAGSDPTEVAHALFCLLAEPPQAYDPVNNDCQ
jgi:hypothetical protein